MHSSLARAQNVFGFFTTVAFVVALLVAASDYFAVRDPSADVKVGKVEVIRGRPHYYSTKKEEYASIRFSLDADFSSLFTWNTKQIFVYVTASWPSNTTSAPNTAVIWDTIITSPSADHLANLGKIAKRNLLKSGEGKSIDKARGVLRLRNQKPKYRVTTPEGRVAGREGVRLRVEYNVQPWVGALAWDLEGGWGRWRGVRGGVSEVFELPVVREKRKEGEGRV